MSFPPLVGREVNLVKEFDVGGRIDFDHHHRTGGEYAQIRVEKVHRPPLRLEPLRGARWDKALPAAVLDFLDVRPSLNTLEAALAALAPVFRFFIGESSLG
jgi:hypothetical protein